MSQFEITLADKIDLWAAEGHVLVTEAAGRISLRRLQAGHVQELIRLMAFENWDFEIYDETEERVSEASIADGFPPFRASITIPNDAAARVLTKTGLKGRLQQVDAEPDTVIRLPSLSAPIDTFRLRLAPWNDDTAFEAVALVANPRQFVRETGDIRVVASDLGPWVLRSEARIKDFADSRVKIWAEMSASRLLHSLADDVASDGSFTFRGPPALQFDLFSDISHVSIEGFHGLHDLVRWVYESQTEAESRKVFVAGEIIRSSYSGHDSVQIAEVSGSLLYGARIANQLGLQKISIDAIKAMSELRKAVSDEATRLSEATRSLANSVAASLLAGIGVIAARLSVAVSGQAVDFAVVAVAVVSFMFVAAVALSGWRFLSIQRQLRSEWRERLYRYLSPEEYERMVVSPAVAAERIFQYAAWASLLCALLNSTALYLAAYPTHAASVWRWFTTH